MKVKTILLAISILFTAQANAYSSEPTKQDFKDFYGLMKVLYSNMPTLMNGYEIIVDADFDIKKIEDKSKVCDFVHAAETVTYVSKNAKVHPEFLGAVESLKQTISPENAAMIKKELQKNNYPCI